MTDQITHLRIATSTGLAHWALIAHASAGTVGLVTGFLALAVAKGSRVHRVAGRVFVYAMVTMGLLATGIAAYEGNTSSLLGGLFAAYLIFTAMTTVRTVGDGPNGLAVALGIFALAFGAVTVYTGVGAMGSPTGMKNGVPFGMYFFLGTIALLAGTGDMRMIRSGGAGGARRLARHLWRMCFGLFIASGSFFLGQNLRENGGGSPAMVSYVSSYLFSRRTHLNDIWNRRTGQTEEFWTRDSVPGRRFGGEKPVFVLTSANTFSGAEEFTYNLKAQKRATIVGEVTGGGAHPVGPRPVGNNFVIAVPHSRAINPITHTNWEGVGVEPDIKVPAADALATALKRLRDGPRP
jgi:uncharacterized membrane protein